jgi:hypothetical protein
MALVGGRRRCRGGRRTENYIYRRRSRFLAGRLLSFLEAAVGWVLALVPGRRSGMYMRGKGAEGPGGSIPGRQAAGVCRNRPPWGTLAWALLFVVPETGNRRGERGFEEIRSKANRTLSLIGGMAGNFQVF